MLKIEGMCAVGTPLEHYPELGLWVKREDLSCPGGPNFSKTRGVYSHVAARPERVIGVLDTYHSQGGWAVARACQQLGKKCVLFYPVRKAERGAPVKPQQAAAVKLGAELFALQAGRSAVLYHEAKKRLVSGAFGGTDPGQFYMMPNALKLPEMITETVAEVARTEVPDNVYTVVVSASSGTIAAGVWRGLYEAGFDGTLVVHQGYDRSQESVRRYMTKMAWGERPPSHGAAELVFINEGYAYGDTAKPGAEPPFPCNQFYDLKAFRWWMGKERAAREEAVLWNIG